MTKIQVINAGDRLHRRGMQLVEEARKATEVTKVINNRIQGIVNEQQEIELIISKIAPYADKVQLEDGIYQGQLSEGHKPVGYGQLTLPDGTVFQTITRSDETGTYQTGKIAFTDGTIYNGTLRNKICHGNGQMILPDGKIIRGNFNDGQISDHQAIMFANGDVFSGKLDPATGTWIGALLQNSALLTVGEFDFDNMGKRCLRFFPEFHGTGLPISKWESTKSATGRDTQGWQMQVPVNDAPKRRPNQKVKFSNRPCRQCKQVGEVQFGQNKCQQCLQVDNIIRQEKIVAAIPKTSQVFFKLPVIPVMNGFTQAYVFCHMTQGDVNGLSVHVQSETDQVIHFAFNNVIERSVGFSLR